MSVHPYPAYKKSGVKWVDSVPSDWEVRPFKAFVAQIESGTSVNADDRPAARGEWGVLKTSCVYTGEFDADENKAVLPGEYARASCPLRIDALIVSRMNTPDLVGAAGLVKEYRPDIYLPDRLWQVILKVCCPHFVYYWTRSALYRAQVLVACDGTSSSMKNLSQDQFLSLSFCSPPIEDQRAIASFLDRETGKIDALVAEQERLIALLKEKRQAVISQAVTKGLNPDAPMKPSGVEWLGEVPEGWEVARIGSLFREIIEEGQADLPVLSVSIHDGVSDRELSDEEMDRKVARSDDRSKYKAVQPGDLVYNMMRAWQGGFGTVAVRGMVSPAYVVARPRGNVRTELVELVLRTSAAIEQMRRYSKGVTDFRLRLYWDEFKQLQVPVPPTDEQTSIFNFVDQQSSRSDALADAVESAIALLKERRAALISAAVTGKIDVRNLVQPSAEQAVAA